MALQRGDAPGTVLRSLAQSKAASIKEVTSYALELKQVLTEHIAHGVTGMRYKAPRKNNSRNLFLRGA